MRRPDGEIRPFLILGKEHRCASLCIIMFSPEMKLYKQAKIVLWGIYEASVD